MAGVKVTLKRGNGASLAHKDYGPETRLFKEAISWKFEFHEEVRTLLLIGVVRHEHGEKFIAEFLVDVVESVEFV